MYYSTQLRVDVLYNIAFDFYQIYKSIVVKRQGTKRRGFGCLLFNQIMFMVILCVERVTKEGEKMPKGQTNIVSKKLCYQKSIQLTK